jgi:hypothetical protein
MRALTFVSLLLFPIWTMQAQTRGGTVAGRVTDTLAAAVPGATVQLLGTGYSARTRDDGS